MRRTTGRLCGVWICLLVTTAFVCAGGELSPQATAPVHLEDPSYEILERIHANLPLLELVHGQ